MVQIRSERALQRIGNPLSQRNHHKWSTRNDGDIQKTLIPSLHASEAASGSKTAQKVWGSGPRDVWGLAAGSGVVHYDGVAWTILHVDASLTQALGGAGPGDVFLGCAGGLLRRVPAP